MKSCPFFFLIYFGACSLFQLMEPHLALQGLEVQTLLLQLVLLLLDLLHQLVDSSVLRHHQPLETTRTFLSSAG